MPLQGWKRELAFLKKMCDEREAQVLPAAALEWIDLNRDAEGRRAYSKEHLDGLYMRVHASGFRMHDWLYHTDAYGWRLLMQRYRREEHGHVHYLLCVERATKPTDKDKKHLGNLLEYLGVDIDKDYLLTTRGPDDPDSQDYWTWKTPTVPS